MSLLGVLAALVLLLLAATASLGVVSLRAWWLHRTVGFPARRSAAHIALQALGLAVWLLFLIALRPWIAWAAFVLITAGQVLGDLLMFASHRARHGGARTGGYGAVALEVLGFSRPAPALHAIIGALAWFGMLAVCLVATFQ